jgi:hypothetical protein
MKAVRRRLGTAITWVACLAVFAAPAIAAGTSEAATSAAIPKQSFAVVGADGTLVRGTSDILSSDRVAAGAYEVLTNHAVTNCAYVADPGVTGSSGSINAPAFTVTALRAGTTTGVFVNAFDRNGVSADFAFHLHIDCNPKGYWAVINADASVSRGSTKLVGATHLGTGTYQVDFVKKVNKCAYTANVGNPAAGNPAALTMSLASRYQDKFGVYIEVRSTSGVLTDSSFHLDIACGANGLDAVVDGSGTLIRGSLHATGASHLTTGAYEVDFDQNVSGCGYVASVAQPGTGVANQATVTVAGRAGVPQGVFVQTFNLAGTPTDSPFHLIVYC